MILRNLIILVSIFFISACATFSRQETLPGKKEISENAINQIENQTSPHPKELNSFHVNDPAPPQIVDKELLSVPPHMQPKVEQWIAYFQGKGRPHMERYLARSTRYIELMKRILRQNALPEDLVYIVLIESGFSSKATSRAAAVGYWQFIKPTGRRYGLEINSLVDERRDPVLSTQAAAEYYKGLYSVFGSWYLSMASYNVGENRVKKEIVRNFTQDFWELAKNRRLPRETVNYIPKFIAARMIAKDPERYGFSEIEFEKPIEFELVKVDKPVNLKMMSEKLGLDYADFKLLNPRFRGEIAPAKTETGLELRVPIGQKDVGLAAAQASFVDKVKYIADSGETETYRVRRGDSLYTIARKFRTTIAWLRDVNDIKSGRKLRIGMRIQVPDRSGSNTKTKPAKIAVKEVAAASSDDTQSADTNPEVETSSGVFYVVQQGDTLSQIAEEYDTSIREIKKLNRLGRGHMIQVGMKLRVPPKDQGLPTSLEDANAVNASILQATNFSNQNKNQSANGAVEHTVKSGESLYTIAKQYGVSIQDIQKANQLRRRSKIMSGTTLIIPIRGRPSSATRYKLLKPRVHIVKAGENLFHIAERYRVNMQVLIKKNKLKKNKTLFVGTKLIIPAMASR